MDAGAVYAQTEPPVPQPSPAPVTLPPVGTGLMVIVYGGPVGSPAVKVAVQVLTASTVTVVLVLVPEQLPPQLVNEYPESAAAVSVTEVDEPYVTEQVPVPLVPQLMPPPVTVPFVGVVTTN
jgi:hypothetical protein